MSIRIIIKIYSMQASEQCHHNSYDSNDNDILPQTEERHTDRPKHTFCIFVLFLFIFMFFFVDFRILNSHPIVWNSFFSLLFSGVWCCRFSVVVTVWHVLCAQTHAFTIHTTYIGYVNENVIKMKRFCMGKRAESKSEYMCARARTIQRLCVTKFVGSA